MKGKLPNIERTIYAMTQTPYGREALKIGLISYLVGEFGNGLPFIGKYSNALKKFGENSIKYQALASAVITWNWNPHAPANTGSGMQSSGNSPSWRYTN